MSDRPNRHYILLTVGITAIISLVSPSSASSHPWTTSDLVVWEDGPSNYSAKGRLLSSNKYDFHGFIITVKKDNRHGAIVTAASSVCGQWTTIGNTCGTHSFSPTVNFPQSKHYLFSQHCATDGSHSIHPWSHGQYWGACAGHNVDLNTTTVY